MTPKRKIKKIGLLQPMDDSWSVSHAPLPSKRRSTRSGIETVAVPLPDFMSPEEFQVLDEAELRSNPGRRSLESIASANLQLKVDLPENTKALVIARQESGALSFHFPVPSSTRRSAAPSSKATLTFEISVSDGLSEKGRRGIASKVIRVVLVKVAKAVVGSILDHAAELVVPKLARALEEHLWKDKTQGWLRVIPEALSGPKDILPKGKPAFPATERGLLFIHGTFSTAYGGFKGLAGTAFFSEARKLYGENFYAFNHFTISKTPEENITELLDSLPNQDFEFDIITHSRGGLVVRELLEGSGLSHPKRKWLKIGRVIMVASPNMGTPLGGPSHWDKKLSLIANLLELVPDNPFTTGAAWLTEALKWAASNVLANCTGLAAMDPASSYIKELQGPPGVPDGTTYHAMVSNFNPPTGWLPRLADMGVDTFFEGANDLVVPTEGGWKAGALSSDWITPDHIACFGPGGNFPPDSQASIHHLNFFSNPEAVSFVLACLRSEPSRLQTLDPARPLPSRNIRLIRGGDFSATGASPLPIAKVEEESPDETPEALNATAESSGWDLEDELSLTVVSNKKHASVKKERSNASVPLLIAKYGGARVVVPFYTMGNSNEAGRRWKKILAYHSLLVRYANGEEVHFPQEKEVSDAPSLSFLEEFGHELFRTLFPPEVQNLYNVARFRHKNRRLKIIFNSMIPWVADIPWEFAYDRSARSFLSCGDVRFVRNVLTSTPENRFKAKSGPLRVLVVSSQPSGVGLLSIEDEELGIQESFRPLIDAGLVKVDVLAGATPSLLHERLRYQFDEFDVLHFIGHGEFDEESNTGYLIFQDSTGRPQRLSGANFLKIIQGRGIRVVFLNACETGQGGTADYNRGVAMELAHDGFPAVVANQYSVIDRSASLFSLHFYSCLAHGLNICDSMREARIALNYCGVELIDWGVPVLFATRPDATLCTATCAPEGTRAYSETPFSILSHPANVTRNSSGSRQEIIAVWDAENALIYRENLQATLDELNQAQDSYIFRLERFSAPRNLWRADTNPESSDAVYLPAEKVIGRMSRIRESIGADRLFCVTNLPLRDDETTALYYFSQENISIFSTWGLRPPLTKDLLKKAIANYLAISILDNLPGVYPRYLNKNSPQHPINTTGFFNNERLVPHIAGQMTITKKVGEKIKKAIQAKKISKEQFASVKILLSLY